MSCRESAAWIVREAGWQRHAALVLSPGTEFGACRNVSLSVVGVLLAKRLWPGISGTN